MSWLSAFLLAAGSAVCGQAPAAEQPAAKIAPPPATNSEKPQLPFQVQLLETKIRFEANGDSRKEVHTIVKIINILGAQQFARISFNYNRNFQNVEIPLVRVSHANGGTSEVLPSAVADAPSAAAQPFPAYHDVRLKAVRILGLQEGDTVEYRVITTTTKSPLAPDFWLEHTFDRSGQVLEEHYELDLPASQKVDLRVNPKAESSAKEKSGEGETARQVYRWTRKYQAPKDGAPAEENPSNTSDVALSTLNWEFLAIRLAELLLPGSKPFSGISGYQNYAKELNRQPEVAPAIREKANSLTQDAKNDLARLMAIYDFVSTKITTVDLPLEATGFRSRPAELVLNSEYATGQDKYVLFAALATAVQLHVDPVLTGFCDKTALPTPAVFKHLVVVGSTRERQYWMDPAVEVAPFGMISPPGASCGLFLNRGIMALSSPDHEWMEIPAALPFAATQRVTVDANLTDSGQLNARVKYVVRGENELLLRVAFHQTPKEKWKEVAGLLSLSDGFRGQVTKVDASDPKETKEPFTVEYELTQLNFVDWARKPVRIPALLPQIGLPDPPAAGATAPIELGTPLDVQTSMTLHVPQGTAIQTPAATAVTRDYASFSSKYAGLQNTVVASRHIAFLKRELPSDRAADYNAFSHAVQSDSAQRIVLMPKPKAE
jgi:uncharacterized protein DUF3857